MPAPFSLLALDLHNTLYDEVMEYGLALDGALHFWQALARERGIDLPEERLCKELAEAHRRLASDWDGDVWRTLPSLQASGLNDGELSAACRTAQDIRLTRSRQLTQQSAYPAARRALIELKRRGVAIYLVTEAAADAAMRAVDWLGLGGILNGVYSYPSRAQPMVLHGTWHKTFPSGTDSDRVKKPHPYILATLMLDEGERRGLLPSGLSAEEAFCLHDAAACEAEPGIQTKDRAKLIIRQTPHAPALRQIRDSLLYVGDSRFKDGFLARNAGVAFGYAAYGKTVSADQAVLHAKSLDILYKVTGWDGEVLKLTQDASCSEEVRRLKPDFIFENGLDEALALFF